MSKEWSHDTIHEISIKDKESRTAEEAEYFDYWKKKVKAIMKKHRFDRTAEETELYKKWQDATITPERLAQRERNRAIMDSGREFARKKREKERIEEKAKKKVRQEVMSQIAAESIDMYSREIDLESRDDVKRFLMEFIEKDTMGIYTSIENVIGVQPYDIAMAIKEHRLDKDEEVKWCVKRRLEIHNAVLLRMMSEDPKTANVSLKIIATNEQREKLSSTWKPDKKEETKDRKISMEI